MKNLIKYGNPFSSFTKFEYCLWIVSILVMIGSYIFGAEHYPLALVDTIIGVTALMFNARGNVWGQILTVVFSLIYGYLSFRQHYYGEMITYMGMTMPIAALSVFTWLRNPFGSSGAVTVSLLSRKKYIMLIFATIIVTVMFYFILKALNTPRLMLSTLSVTTSFSACALTALRIPIYAICYSCNDIILVVLWIYACLEDMSNLPMVFCFMMFLVNDIYGFISWKRMEYAQKTEK